MPGIHDARRQIMSSISPVRITGFVLIPAGTPAATCLASASALSFIGFDKSPDHEHQGTGHNQPYNEIFQFSNLLGIRLNKNQRTNLVGEYRQAKRKSGVKGH